MSAELVGDGDCYEVALTYCINLRGDDRDRYRVCHGTPLGQGAIEGVRHGHAWVERTDVVTYPANGTFAAVDMPFVIVIDESNGKQLELPQVLYYKIGHIDEHDVVRYTVDEALALALESETWGPW